jgi:UTP--glucose-1-phosphate uridylyltransferase
LLKTQKIIANQYEGKCYDVGSKIGFLKATVDFALDRSELKAEFLHYLSAVLKGNGSLT